MDRLAKIWVSGVVQGVGFRFFVNRLASQYGLGGIVKNLPDGRVYIEVEGDREVIQAFLKDVRVGHPWARVTDIQVEWLPFEGKYRNFRITY
jgi:acylphosphatase